MSKAWFLFPEIPQQVRRSFVIIPPPSDRPFEVALAELESIVDYLERGDLSLEDSLKSFQRGVELTRHCHDTLEKAEARIRVLTGDDPEASLEAFRDDR